MPKAKKDQGDVEVVLEDENGDEVTFKFKPFGILGLRKALKEDPNISIRDFQKLEEYMPDQEEAKELSDEEFIDRLTEIPDELPDEVEVGDAIFRGAIQRCTSHMIVDRDLLDDKIQDPSTSDEEREKARKKKEMADYYMDNFTHQEQAEILDEVMEQEQIEEGMKEAENFRGD